MNQPQRALVVGDVIDDVVARVEMPLRPNTDTPARILRESGGSAANNAVWLAAEGIDVDFVGRVGRVDAERFDAEFAAAGVTAHLEHDTEFATGTIVILVEGAIRSMLSDRGANVELDPTRIPLVLLESARVVHLTGYSIFHHHTRCLTHQGFTPGGVQFARGGGKQRIKLGVGIAPAIDRTCATRAVKGCGDGTQTCHGFAC